MHCFFFTHWFVHANVHKHTHAHTNTLTQFQDFFQWLAALAGTCRSPDKQVGISKPPLFAFQQCSLSGWLVHWLTGCQEGCHTIYAPPPPPQHHAYQ